MTTALGIAPDEDGNGVTPLTHRMVQRFQYESTGILGGFDVDTTTGLTYDVGEGVAVTSRGDSDGYALAYFEGGSIETTSGSSSYSRYDVIWVKSNDPEQGDDDNQVTLGITHGSAGSSPTVPDPEDGATAVAVFLVPAGATATNSCEEQTGEVDYAIPYGAAAGSYGGSASTTTNKISTSSTSIFSKTITVPTNRYVECKGVFRCMYDIDPDDDYNGDSCGDEYATVFVSCYVDGELFSDGSDCIVAYNAPVRNVQIWRLSLSKGTHTIQVKVQARTSPIYWAGVREVWLDDCGVAE